MDASSIVISMERENMKLYLVRHGETDWNLENKIQGQTDTSINDNGREQAKELAERIKEELGGIKRIYSSRQKRALETAQIIGRMLSVSPIVQQGLEEICLGAWEGYTWKQVKEIFSEEYQIWHQNRRYQVPPKGESYQQLLDRLLPALDDIIRKEGQDVLIVTHSAVIMTLMSYVYDTPFENMAKNYRTGNATIVELDSDLFYDRYSAE